MNFSGVWRAVACLVSVMTLAAFAQPQSKTLAELLVSAAKYLEDYEQRSGAVVSLETYTQHVQRGSSSSYRHLKSDLLTLSVGTAGWLGFRDVFEVDGRPVRDHDERLYKLFLTPSADSLAQAKKILDEGARFNIGQVTRNINIPTMVLTFLKRDYQPRSRFTDKGIDVIDGVRTRVVAFSERASPRVISTPDGSPAQGRFWIDAAHGRVVRTELTLSGAVHLVITVEYGPQPRLDNLLVPVSMREVYRRAGEVTDGRATYSNFRSFKVDVSTIVK